MKTKQNNLLTGLCSVALVVLTIGCMKKENNRIQPENINLMTELQSIKVENTNIGSAREINFNDVFHADVVGYMDAFLHGTAGTTDPLHEASIASFCEWIAQNIEAELESAVITNTGTDIGNANNSFDNAGTTHNSICQMVISHKNSWLRADGTTNWVSLRAVSDSACRIYCNKPFYSINPGRFTYFSTNFLSSSPNSSQQSETLLTDAVNANALSPMDHSVMSLYLSQIATFTNINDLCTYSISYENQIVASQNPTLHKAFLLSCFSIVRHSACFWKSTTITP